MNRSNWRFGFILTLLLLACFALWPVSKAFAVSPTPDGGYPGGNTAEGTDALLNLTSGIWNTALGFEALNHDTAGKINTATGLRALFSNTSGSNNTATGVYALYSNTVGWYNNAVGAYALSHNTIGNYNTANGYGALYYNTEGEQNTATGFAALYRNTTGGVNTAVGYQALNRNTIGSDNTAVGYDALLHNTEGTSNTANGVSALVHNTTGSNNTANGVGALVNNTEGASNTANGYLALNDNTTGNNNTAIGYVAGLNITGSGNVCIGQGVVGVAGEDNTIRIRNVYTTVQPVVGIDPDLVTVDSSGRLGRGNVSSRRYKHDIKPMDNASEAILALKPVTFRYNKEFDPTQTLAFGLIAEEVAEVYPDLVGRNPEGQPESVRYEQINAMLLNEFLKEHGTVQELKSTAAKQEATIAQQGKDLQATIAKQQEEIQALTASLKEQAAQIQKVSAQLEASRPTPKVVLNNQ